MIKHERERLNTSAKRSYMLLRFRKGCISIITSYVKIAIVIAYVLTALWIIDFGVLREISGATSQDIFANQASLLGQATTQVAYVLIAIVGLFALIIEFGMPFGGRAMRGNLLRIGFANSAGEAPILVGKRKYKENNKTITDLDFFSCGIPSHEWVDKRLKLEAALNLNIIEISQGKDKHYIRLGTVSAKDALPKKVNWKDSYLSRDSFVLVLGESLLGVETVNLSLIPHILLGGATGSGKSVNVGQKMNKKGG